MTKVKVHLWSGLRALTDGQEVVEVEARTIGDMLTALAKAYPGLQDTIEAGVSVAIDGRVMAMGLTEPVSPDNEIYLMQRIKGG